VKAPSELGMAELQRELREANRQCCRLDGLCPTFVWHARRRALLAELDRRRREWSRVGVEARRPSGVRHR
jgi:hypothetical protein